MQVKVGNKTYGVKDEMIMVILTDRDKKNIANMLPECSKYCQYSDEMSEAEVNKFMEIENE